MRRTPGITTAELVPRCVDHSDARGRNDPPPCPGHRTSHIGSLTMLRTSILLCTASAAALSLVESPSVNDYELVATGKDCPQDGRINLPCGNCGPNVSVALTRTIFCTLLRTAHAL